MVGTYSDIYRRNAWNGVESLSGPGSGTSATALISRALVDLAAELGIRSVLDVACGDSFWMPDLPGYVGVDIAPEAVERSRRAHPERSYAVADARSMDMGAFDLVICRDAMQHMPLADGLALLTGVRASGSTWLLASTYLRSENIDVADGGHFSPDLSAPPFNLGKPERLILDGYDYGTHDAVRDDRKHLGLWPA